MTMTIAPVSPSALPPRPAPSSPLPGTGKAGRGRAVVDDQIPFIREGLRELVDEVVYLPGHAIGPADVAEADILIVRTRTRCDRRLLEGSRVRLVVTATIGYDHLDTAYLDTAGIRWANCPGCNASSVRQYVHNALLALGLLKPSLLVGIVGVGHVGSLVARDLQAAGMTVLPCDPLQQAAGAPPPTGTAWHSMEALCHCDIISFHPDLTYTGAHPSFHLADAAFFQSLRRRPVVINTSRGEVVDEEALLQALRSGLVGGAVIDTWEHEPHINRALLEAVSLGTPHIAGYSADGKANAARMALQAVAQFVGIPLRTAIHPPALPAHFAYGPFATDGPLRLYDPRIDSLRLRRAPEAFESLRGNYPLRRENGE